MHQANPFYMGLWVKTHVKWGEVVMCHNRGRRSRGRDADVAIRVDQEEEEEGKKRQLTSSCATAMCGVHQGVFRDCDFWVDTP